MPRDDDMLVGQQEPGVEGREASLQAAGQHAVALTEALSTHLHNRAETQAQLEEELAKEQPNGLYTALKELEIAVHDSAVMQGVGTLAMLAAFGVIVRPPEPGTPEGATVN
jgi:hypothetical protein